MFWKQGNKAVYRKSNSINDTLFQPNNAATHYTKKLLTSMDASERQVLGQGLFEEMARSLSIPVPQLLVNDKRQNHSLKDGKLRRKVYGTYKAGNMSSVIRQRYERPCLSRRHSWTPSFTSLCIITITRSSNSQRVCIRQVFITGLEM